MLLFLLNSGPAFANVQNHWLPVQVCSEGEANSTAAHQQDLVLLEHVRLVTQGQERRVINSLILETKANLILNSTFKHKKLYKSTKFDLLVA
jgi:hypothetical protein